MKAICRGSDGSQAVSSGETTGLERDDLSVEAWRIDHLIQHGLRCASASASDAGLRLLRRTAQADLDTDASVVPV